MSAEPASPSSKKKTLSLSRMLLILILVAALGGLGLDQYSKRQMEKLDQLLTNLKDQNDSGEIKDLTPQLVQSKAKETAGKAPTRSSVTADEFDFPGVFYTHRVTVKYRVLDKNRGIIAYDGHRPGSVFRFGGVAEE